MKVSVAAAMLALLVPALCRAADLRVADSTGTQVIVRNAAIDYAAGIAAVRESSGIRVLQGEGTVTVKWADVQSIEVRRDDSVKPARLEADVLLRNGRHVSAVLQRNGDATLRGRTELGDYAIDLEKVRSIEPLR
jgi:hypothetical protein